MTNKDNLQKELLEKVKPGIKASDLKKLKRSKSADDISSVPPTPALQKSKSQLEIPIANQPTPSEQIAQLQDQIKFHAQTSQNYLQSLQQAQAKITELEEELQAQESFVDALEENPAELKTKISQLEDKILELRLEKIKEFGDYYQKKKALEGELELNVNEGIQEIQRLENQLLATNKKKLELAQKLGTAQSKIAQLELEKINEPTNSNASFNYWVLVVILVYWLVIWLLSKNTNKNHE